MAKPTWSAEEIAQLIDDFTNDRGLWYQFKEFIEEKGYKVEDIGLDDE